MRLAYFVSPHGFGHAARACAVIEACRRLRPELEFLVFGGTPAWFFTQSLERPVEVVEAPTDVGLRQRSALATDLPATATALERFLPFEPEAVAALGRRLGESGCRAVLCDVSPLGIAAAGAAGLPSILVENFTWDWIYEPLVAAEPRLEPFVGAMRELFARADRHVQVIPVCAPAAADLTAPPVARSPRLGRAAARRALGLPAAERVVLVTLGGIPQPLAELAELRRFAGVTFIVSGMPGTRREGNLLLYDNDTPLYMPDLLAAADAVVAKLGYSTLAEVWSAGRPAAWVARSDFRETAVLREFAAAQIPGFTMPDSAFLSGAWIDRIEELLAVPGRPPRPASGAEAVARFVLSVAG